MQETDIRENGVNEDRTYPWFGVLSTQYSPGSGTFLVLFETKGVGTIIGTSNMIAIPEKKVGYRGLDWDEKQFRPFHGDIIIK
jgi:hypothetical protein